uniref:ATP synthase F0 subunit 8 n=1 Tax=Coluber constrictor TaxID=8590 RepID=UPI0023AA9EB8|nr:ATP synthase F0 subunit 8 [Coluber constrictor]WCO10294.1 ATP synthase F0 subunit 8 [Coluber constrictor]WCO10307.1 ATP synthase F0 subunit 8 [Coluber constrictor]WCO10320.1 ATP synthase F0 subunit 8 [Coluber constrictor]WCO10333.1 ATP synthase F0 subunit 8 [Coluber constrictor]WCO10346.1 ATP synthase F0 subunit 8 [Coluber constrictor]
MPQLDTIFITIIYMWTWLMLHLMMQKIKIFMMTNPTTQTMPKKPTPTLQWL